jgi:hypothetical protein
MRLALLVAALMMSMLSPTAQAGALKDMSLSVGGTAGVAIGWVAPVASPTASTSLELGGTKVRWYSALDLNPTLYFDLENATIFPIPPILSLSTGPTFGNDTFRVGAYGFISYRAVGTGLRVAAITSEGKRGGRHGWEARATLNIGFPASITTTGLYTWHLPMKRL